jgi:hypothetical protein
MKPLMNVSFSGGRTSGYMTKMLIDNWSDRFDMYEAANGNYRRAPDNEESGSCSESCEVFETEEVQE